MTGTPMRASRRSTASWRPARAPGGGAVCAAGCVAVCAAALVVCGLVPGVSAIASHAPRPRSSTAEHGSSGIAPTVPVPVPVPVPTRIVSLNLCTDQLVVRLVDRSRIAALTWLAFDRSGSVVADEAAGIPVTYGTAEEITRLDPDLIIAGRYTTRTTVALLRRFGYPVVEFETPTTFEGIEAQIRQLARLVGTVSRGEAIVADMQARLARVEAARGASPGPIAAIFGTNGGTQGAGTLTDTVIRASGLRNMASEAGLRGQGQMSLERLLLSRPDVIILPDLSGVTMSVGQQLLAHPALTRRALASRVVHLPGKWTSCGGPWTVEAVEHLQRVTR